jgi:hypothetical protein
MTRGAPHYILLSSHTACDVRAVEGYGHYLDMDLPYIVRYLMGRGIVFLHEEVITGITQYLND